MMYWLLNGEPTIVDETKENWRDLYLKISWDPFESVEPVEVAPETTPVEEAVEVQEGKKAEEIIEEPTLENNHLKTIQNMYVELYGKQLSPAYKNNVAWIEEKINATFTPSE